MVFCVGGFKNTAKNKWNEIDSKGNWPALNLVMVLGNEMDVQHTHRWQNRDVAFLMDSALLKKKRRREGSDIVENKVCIWLCRCTAETGRLLHLQRDILLWNWINARIRAKMQWQLRWLFLLVWQTTDWKKGWRLKLKEAKTATFPLSKLFLPFFLFSLTNALVSCFLSLTQSTVGLNNTQTD